MNAAFSDYSVPTQLTPSAFDRMMLQRGLNTEVSKVAVARGRIVSFWFMSVRGDQAYLIASGTLPAFRGRGLSTQLAHSVLDDLRASNVSSFHTEVLEHNNVAQRLYARIGMTRVRRLGCCTVSQPMSGPHFDIDLVERKWSDVMAQIADMRDWQPTWQNSDASLAALGTDVMCICATQADQISGYIAVFKKTHTVAQLAVKKSARRKGIGRELLRNALRGAPGAALRFINYADDDPGFSAFLKAHHANSIKGQFDLILRL
ncbi:GNAT family N-acetyltransferase [Roseobacter sp. CCS2]|uniref:GNAT family N-acetyltransferase n=1 Tax=Roseobacter sp. CCS2 TaxID=391593 RepID=UPI0000F4004E|nr:GNAT family N-acetyltransferase [Roseobacter sp. CCS2]EBA13704.1 acetyltransferase, GNAT family protein [Roseobacter sp. CCS2]